MPEQSTKQGEGGGGHERSYSLSVRQRFVLQCLVEEGGVSNLVALARECAARIYDCPAERISRETRQRLFSELTTPAVKSLNQQGLVEYDDEGTVTLVHQHG